MKSLIKLSFLLLVACLFQNCRDLSFDLTQSEEAINAQAVALKASKNKNALTLTAVVKDDYQFPANQFLVSIQGTAGSISVNWGDGTSTSYTMDGNFINLEKIYAEPGRYNVGITGDIKNITFFTSAYNLGVFDNINLAPLTGLKSLRIVLTSGPQLLDLRNNKKLEELSLTDVDELTHILMPKHHLLKSVSISGPNSLQASTVNTVINSVYQTAVKKGIYDGYFDVRKLFYEEESTEMIGPPFEQALAQLKELQDIYNWEIHPLQESTVSLTISAVH